MQNNEIIRQLIDKKIVTISTDKDFVYASGMHSPSTLTCGKPFPSRNCGRQSLKTWQP